MIGTSAVTRLITPALLGKDAMLSVGFVAGRDT